MGTVSVLQDEKVLEISYDKVHIVEATSTVYFKMVKMANFMSIQKITLKKGSGFWSQAHLGSDPRSAFYRCDLKWASPLIWASVSSSGTWRQEQFSPMVEMFEKIYTKHLVQCLVLERLIDFSRSFQQSQALDSSFFLPAQCFFLSVVPARPVTSPHPPQSILQTPFHESWLRELDFGMQQPHGCEGVLALDLASSCPGAEELCGRGCEGGK